MVEVWVIPPGKPTVRSWFGGKKISLNHQSITNTLCKDTWDGDSNVYEEEYGIGISRCRTNGKITYDVYELDELCWGRTGIVTIFNAAFEFDELDDAIKLFIKLVKNPIKKKKSKIPPFIFIK
jgi:hypothetical protein